ncbi:hypothetical protein L9F63_024211, partial [Diploptera punctata]
FVLGCTKQPVARYCCSPRKLQYGKCLIRNKFKKLMTLQYLKSMSQECWNCVSNFCSLEEINSQMILKHVFKNKKYETAVSELISIFSSL